MKGWSWKQQGEELIPSGSFTIIGTHSERVEENPGENVPYMLTNTNENSSGDFSGKATPLQSVGSNLASRTSDTGSSSNSSSCSGELKK